MKLGLCLAGVAAGVLMVLAGVYMLAGEAISLILCGAALVAACLLVVDIGGDDRTKGRP